MTFTRTRGAAALPALRLVLLVAIVSACGSPAPSGIATPSAPTGSGQTPAPTPQLSPGTLNGNLTVWDTYGTDQSGSARGAPEALTAALDVVRLQNPGLTVTVTHVNLGDLFINLQQQSATGAPDVVFAPNDNLGDLARAGVIADLSNKLTSDQLSHFAQLALDGSKVDNSLMQVPGTMRTVGIYYDSSKIATFPTTTDDLLTAVGNGTIKLGVLQAIYEVFGFWGSFGGQLMDQSGKCVADPTMVGNAFAYYRSLEDSDATWYSGTDGYSRMLADFKSGAVDAVIDGPWAVDAYQDALPKSLAVAPLPDGPSGPALPMSGVDGWTVNAHSPNPDLALAFALRMTQPDLLQILADQGGEVPADPSIQPNDPVTAQFAVAAQHGVARPQVTELGAFWGNFGTALDSVINDNADPTAAVTQACSAMNSANGL